MRILLSSILLVPVCVAFLPFHGRHGGASRSLRRLPLLHGKIKAPVLDDVCETLGVTLTRFMNEVTMLHPELQELTTVFGAIDTACKAISNQVKRSQLPSSQPLGYRDGYDGDDDDVQENYSKARFIGVVKCTVRGCHSHFLLFLLDET